MKEIRVELVRKRGVTLGTHVKVGKQIRVNLTLDEDVVEEAEEIGLSKIAKNAL